MCHFITGVLPISSPSPAFCTIAERHGLLFEAMTNPAIQAQLRPGDEQFRATGQMCDCGTGLGAGASRSSSPDLEKRTAKLRKKGWGEAKIARWIHQQETNERARSRKRSPGSAALSAAEWHAFLVEALACGEVEWIGLLLHWYSGRFDDEDVRFRRQRVGASELSADFLRSIEEDVLYEFLT